MWRDEKTEYLRRNRDYSRLLDGDDAEVPTPRRQNRGRSRERQFDADADDVSPERQEYLNRRRRLKELERQKLTKGKNGLHASGRGDEVQKAGGQNKEHGSSRSGGGLALSKEKKKLPNDSSYGSFFGPTTPIVAKRIIEEARAREEAEIVAARESKATVEAEHRKKVARSSAGKVSRDPRPVQPPKPAYKATEKTRKLKEARDYSFLYDDSPLPDPKTANREGPSSSKLGIRKHDSTSVLINNHSSRKLTSERPKSTPEPRRSGGSTTSSRPLQSQPKSSQLSRSLPRQGHYDSPSNISAMKNMSIVGTSAKPSTSKVSSAGPGRLEPKGETKLRKAEMTKKLVSASRASDVNRSSSAVRRPQPSLTLGRKNPQILERDANQVRDRPRAQQSDRRPTQLPERPPTRQPDRLPSRPAERQPSHATNRNQTQSTGMKPAQVKERERVGTNSSERGAVMSQGLKKGTPTGAPHRTAAIRAETRPKVTASQKLEMKPPPKGASRPALSDYNKARYSEDRWEGQARHKRARSSSEELDERPSVAVNSNRIAPRGRNPSEDDDDSFIDDDDDPANVSSMIHSIMGYNPNKYRGNDDFDDRAMEVGFRTIQAEERRSAREARLEDERELAMIEAEEREERLRKAKKKRKQTDR